MASTASPSPATRIISHMNKDHQDSLVRYLEHYHSVTSALAQFAKMTDMTLSHLTINALGSTYRIPLDPPLKDWAEARERVVAMDQDCIKALQRDSVTLKTYTMPRGPLQVSVGLACAFTFILLGRRATLNPGQDSLLRPLAEKYPDVFQWLWKIQPQVLYPMIAIHLTEASWMAISRLRKHSVPLLSPLWFTWVTSCFIEGFGSFARVDNMVNEEKERRAKSKH